MNLIPILDLAAVLFDITLFTLYLNVFFQRKELPKTITVFLYVLAIVVYSSSSVLLTEAYLKSIVYLLVCLFLATTIYQGKIVYKCVLIFVYVNIGIMLETIMAYVLTFCDVQLHIITSGSTVYYLTGLISSSTLFFCVIIYILRPFQKNILKKLQLQQTMLSSWSALFVALLSITIVYSYTMEYLTIKRGIENSIPFFILMECLILIFDVSIFFIFKQMVELRQKSMNAALIEQQIKSQEAFYQQSIQKNTQLKTIIHDEKNFLLGVIGALQEGKSEYAIMEMQKKVEQLVSNITTYTGILPLDNLLTVKVQDALKNDIVLHPATALYGKLDIDLMDLVLLLGNALDNAIHGAMEAPTEAKREIKLNMKLQDDKLLLEIRNPVKKKVPIKEDRVVLTEKREGLHGFGLANIEHIVKKYNGGLRLDCTDTIFTLKLYLENESRGEVKHG